MKSITNIKKLFRKKPRIEIALLFIILLLVGIPYLPKIYYAYTDWNEQRLWYGKIQKEEKLSREKYTKEQQLFIDYGVTAHESYNDAAYYLSVKAEVNKTKGKYGSCDNPNSPTPTPKTKSIYFDDIDSLKYAPSTYRSDYDEFIENCLKIEQNQAAFIEFDFQIGKITRLIEDNEQSTDIIKKEIANELKNRLNDYNRLKVNAGIIDLNDKNIAGYIIILPTTIGTGETVTIEYGYKDKLNNEHLKDAVTLVRVIGPNNNEYKSASGRVYPNDFSGATTMETGVYQVQVKRTIITTDGREDVLYSASSTFSIIKK